jgi:hypothetical protein
VGSNVVSDEGLIKGGPSSRFEELAACLFVCVLSQNCLCGRPRPASLASCHCGDSNSIITKRKIKSVIFAAKKTLGF